MWELLKKCLWNFSKSFHLFLMTKKRHVIPTTHYVFRLFFIQIRLHCEYRARDP